MAIDTVNKRRSVIGYAVVFAALLPVADGTISAEDRRQVGGEYPFGAGAGVSGSGGATLGGIASAGNGLEVIIGTGTAQQGGVASSGSGFTDAIGSGGSQVGGVASAGSATETVSGSGSAASGGIAGAGSGLFGDNVSGTGTAETGGVAAAGSGYTDVTGTGTAETGGVAGAGAGIFGDSIDGTGGATVGAVASLGSGFHADVHGSGGGTSGGVASAGSAVEAVVGTGGATALIQSSGSGQPAVAGTGGATTGGVAAGGAESTVVGAGGATTGGISASGSGCVPDAIGPVYDCLFVPNVPTFSDFAGDAAVCTPEADPVQATFDCCDLNQGGVPSELLAVDVTGSGGAVLGGVSGIEVIPYGLFHEPSATNNVGYNTDFSITGWDRAGNTVLNGQALGSSTLANLVTGVGVMKMQRTGLTLTNAIQCRSIYWKAGTATGGRLALRNITSGAAEVVLTWDNVGGAPSNLVLTGATGGNGFGFYPVPKAPGWYRVYFWLENFGLTSHTREFSVANTGPAGATGSWALDQFEVGRGPTSPVKTSEVTNATRSADSFVITGLTNLLGSEWTWGFRRRLLLHQTPEASKIDWAVVISSPLQFSRFYWPASDRSLGVEHYSGSAFEITDDALTYLYNKIASLIISSSVLNGRRRVYIDGSLSQVVFGGQLDFTSVDRIGNAGLAQILYSMAAYNVEVSSGTGFEALPANSFPSADRTLYIDLTGQALPVGWVFTRASSALTDDFTELGTNVPRFAQTVM
jgi:hypothetical protein